MRISVTDRCNFRCPYCMPAEIFGESYQFLPKDEILAFEEIHRLARIFSGLGVNKLRITGGEPLLRTDLNVLIGLLSQIPGVEDLTLTTNGYLLNHQAARLKEAGLNRITVSLDTLDDDIFKTMNGRGFDTQRVLQGIQRASEVGLAPIKINAVVQRGVNDHTLVDLARPLQGNRAYSPLYRVYGRRQPQRLEAGPGGFRQRDRRTHRRRNAAGTHGKQLRRRGRQPVPLPGRRGRNRRHCVGYPAILRRLHPGPDLHRWPPFHLPFRHPGRGPEDAIAQRGHR